MTVPNRVPGGSAWYRVVPWLILPLVSVLVAGAAWLGAAQSAGRSMPRTRSAVAVIRADCYMATKAGSYFATGLVTQISAQWVVPTVTAPTSTLESASFWLGIQHTTTGAFIQLGTSETARGTKVNYNAFWSATAKGDKAQPLFSVVPGNVVVADMTRTTKGWRLEARDLTTGRSTSFTLRYARNIHFTQADWAEEDPSLPCTLSPYPDITTVTLSNLRLNNNVPHLRYDDAAVLESPNGIILVPTRALDDGFSLLPPSGPRARYLSDTAQFNIALETFVGAVGQAKVEAVVTHMTSTVLYGARLQALGTAQRALAVARRTQQKLASLPGSTSQRRYVRDVESQLSELMSSLQKAATHFQRSTFWTLRAIGARSIQLERAAGRLRRTLGLPPPSGSDAPL